MAARPLLRRAARALALGLVWTILALALVIAVAGVAVKTDAGKRFIASKIEAALNPNIAGSLVIDDLGTVWLDGHIEGADFRFLGPDGRPALIVMDAAASIDLSTLLDSALGKGPLRLRFPSARVAYADLRIDLQDGEPAIARVFAPEAPTPEEQEAGEPAVRVHVEEAHADRVWVHGSTDALGLVDAELRDVSTGFEATGAGILLDSAEAEWRVRPATFGLPAQGTLEGTVRIPEGGGLPEGHARLAGTVADSPFVVTAELDEEAYSATVRVPSVDPALLHRFTSADEAKVTLEAHGTTERVEASGTIWLDTATLDLSATLDFDSGRLAGDASVSGLDLSTLLQDAPPTDLDAELTLEATEVFSEDRQARARLELERSTVEGTQTPAVDVSVRWSGSTIRGTAKVDEPGAPTRLAYEVRLGPDLDRVETVSVEGHVEIADLNGLARLGPIAAGSGSIDIDATLDVQAERIDAALGGEFRHLERDALGVGHLTLDARAEGPIEAIDLQARAVARDVEVAGRALDYLRAEASGPPSALDVTLTGHGGFLDQLSGSTVVDLTGPPTLEAPRLTAERKGVRLSARARRVGFDRGVSFDELEVDGAGRLEVSGRISEHGVALQAQADELRIAQLGRFVGLEGLDGKVSLSTDLTMKRGTPSGRVTLHGRDLAYRTLTGVDLRGGFRLDGGTVSGDLAMTSEAGVLRASASDLSLRHAMNLDDPRILHRLEGAVEAHARLDLDRLAHVVPKDVLPGPLEGTVVASVRVAGRGSALAPDADILVSADDVVVPASVGVVEPVPLDGWLRGRLDGQTRDLRVAATVADVHGTWLELHAESRAPQSVLRDVSTWSLAPWHDSPLDAWLRAYPRRLARLPLALSPDKLPLDGDVGIRLRATGTFADPELFLSARLTNVDAPSHTTRALDAVALATYADGVSRLRASVAERGHVLANARVVVQGDPTALASGTWTAHGRARLDGLPLSHIAVLSKNDFAGTAYGRLMFAELNRTPKLAGHVALRNFRIGRSRFANAEAVVELEENELSARARLNQRAGGARAALNAKIDSWASAYEPVLDEQETELRLTARSLSPDFVLPFLDGAVTQLDGSIDADLSIQPGEARPLSGSVELSDGVIQTPTLGQTLRDVTLHAEAQGNRIQVTMLRGHGLQGRFAAQGSVTFDGMTLHSAEATLRIPDDHPMPLTLEGVSYGKVSARVDMRAKFRPDDNRLTINVDVPTAELSLSPKTARSVQDLEPAPHVEAGVYLPSGDFRQLPLQLVEPDGQEQEEGKPMTVVVRVDLGRKVVLKRTNQLEARFRGSPTFEMTGGKTAASGQIKLVDGWLDLMGKRFVLEEGTVTFEGDEVANPVVVATARWESPEGTVVRATFRGPVETGNLELSSNPPMSDSAILSLLVLGTTEGTTAGTSAESGSMAAGAAAVGGAVVTQGLDRALTSLTHLDISTRIDTSEGVARPEVMVRFTRRLAVELSYSPDTATPGGRQDTALLTFVLSLPKNWVVETTVGDAGTSIVDLLWRHRY